MNAVATPVEQFTSDNGAGGESDSDVPSEGWSPTTPGRYDMTPEDYEPIDSPGYFVVEDEGEASDEGSETDHRLPNGYAPAYGVEDGVPSLDLSDGEEEEERMREMATERALREDERRRNAPLTAENAGRVMDAMRGVSFGGSPPDWAGRVPEDQWIHQLRTRVTRPSPSAADPSATNES